ncbi:hypothetical protein SAMN05216299_103174 [Nitrosospira sp. Nsp14]|nr:hypothetical protein SAMN05216299_103174 [Nitrosospira sp. Nsp14]
MSAVQQTLVLRGKLQEAVQAPVQHSSTSVPLLELGLSRKRGENLVLFSISEWDMVQMRWYKCIPGDSNAPPGMTVEATSVLRRPIFCAMMAGARYGLGMAQYSQTAQTPGSWGWNYAAAL